MSYIGSIYGSMDAMKEYSDGVSTSSNNLSNVNTPGYKKEDATFSDLIGKDENGVLVNPSQGEIESTGVALQLAISGKGFFLLKSGDTMVASRYGNFDVNENSELILRGTDYVVQSNRGGQLENISLADYVDSNAEASSRVVISGSLDSSISVGDVYIPSGNNTIKFYDVLGEEIDLKVSYRRDSQNSWSILLSDMENNPVAEYAGLQFNNEGELVNSNHKFELNYVPYQISNFNLSSVNQSISDLNNLNLSVVANDDRSFLVQGDPQVQKPSSLTISYNSDGYFVDSNGKKILFDENGSVETKVGENFSQIDFDATNNISFGGELDSSAAIGATFIVDEADNIIVDGDGNQVQFKLEFTKTDVDEWELELKDSSDNVLTSTRTISFLNDGTLSPFSRSFSFDYADETIQVNLNSSNNALSHGAVSDASVIEVDGSPTYALTEISVNEEGRLTFTYDDGTTINGPKLAAVEHSTERTIPIAFEFNQVGDKNLTVKSGGSSLTYDSDGQANGKINSVSFSSDGLLTIQYTNGDSQEVSHLALASLNSINDLERIGEGFIVSNDDVKLLDSSSGLYQIVDGAIEKSNVDVTAEFSELMIMQRGYQANSQVITVSNQMIDELFKTLER